MDSWRELVRRTVQRGLDRYEIRAGSDPEQTASLLIAGMEGAVMMSRLYNDQTHLFRVAGHLKQYVEVLRT